MKSFTETVLKIALVASLVACASVAAKAQTLASADGRLQLSQLDRLASKADEYVNVNLDERLLRFAQAALSSADSEERAAKEVIVNLRGIYVKRFEFETEGGYSPSDLEAIRAQLSSPNWARIVEVRSRRQGQNVEVYLLTNGGRIDGLTILSSEPKEFMVINIVGMIDLEKLSKLRGKFGVPEDLELERKSDAKPQTKRQ